MDIGETNDTFKDIIDEYYKAHPLEDSSKKYPQNLISELGGNTSYNSHIVRDDILYKFFFLYDNEEHLRVLKSFETVKKTINYRDIVLNLNISWIPTTSLDQQRSHSNYELKFYFTKHWMTPDAVRTINFHKAVEFLMYCQYNDIINYQ